MFQGLWNVCKIWLVLIVLYNMFCLCKTMFVLIKYKDLIIFIMWSSGTETKLCTFRLMVIYFDFSLEMYSIIALLNMQAIRGQFLYIMSSFLDYFFDPLVPMIAVFLGKQTFTYGWAQKYSSSFTLLFVMYVLM